MKKKSKHEYVIGWPQDGQAVYGQDDSKGAFRYADPLTLFQARRKLKSLRGAKPCIFKLVIVK